MKKKYILTAYVYVIFYSFICITTSSLYSKHEKSQPPDQEQFAQDFGELLALPDDGYVHHKNGLETPCQAVETIIALNGLDFLQENFYLRTNPTNINALLNIPYFNLHTSIAYCPDKAWQPRVDFFFNQTRLSLYTKESPFIVSYLHLDNPVLIEQIQQLLLDQNIKVNLPLLVSIFENTKIEDRRAGFMFNVLRKRNDWTFEAKIPLIYEFRNFFLTTKEQREIERATLFKGDEKQQLEFAQRYLISDRLGFGDSRINIGYTAINNDSLWFNGGLQLTLPTAAIFTIKKGLYGHHFDTGAAPFRLNLLDLFNFALPTDLNDIEAAKKLGLLFVDAAIDRLSTILIEQGLGNGRHIGLGLFGEYHITVTPHLTFRNQAFIEYETPAWEHRFYLFKKDPAAFQALENNFDPMNETLCQTQLNFIEDQIVNTFFPSMFSTKIAPGWIFDYTGAVSGRAGRNWRLTAGYNLLVESGEKRIAINAPAAIVSQLQLGIAKRPTGYQNKVLGIIDYERSAQYYDWCFSSYVDYTFLSTGIGKDLTIILGLKLTF